MVQQLALSPLALLAWGCFPELLVLRCSHFSSKLLSCFVAWPSIQIWVGHISVITRMYWVREITDIEWTSLHWISLDNRKRPLAHKGTSTCQVPLSPSLGCQQSKKNLSMKYICRPLCSCPWGKLQMRKVSVVAKWTWASSVIVVTDGVSVPRFVPLSPLVFCAFQHGDGLWAKVLCHLSSGWVCSWGQESEAGCAFPISTCLSALGLILTPRQRLWKSVPLLIVVRDRHSLGQKPNRTAFYVILYLTVHN